jgi:hypothetical protein
MLAGPAQAFQLLPPDTLKINLDLKHVRPGSQEITLTRDMVRTPSNLTVVGFSPEQIRVVTSRLLPLTVPIEVLTENVPPQGLTVRTTTVTPPEVKVLIPRRLRGKRIRIMTEPIDLSLLDIQKIFTPVLRYPPEIQFAGGKPPLIRVVIKTRASTAAPPR